MELQKNGRAIRWAYMFEDFTPCQTTLCAMFWRTVMITPLKLAFLASIISLVLYTVFWIPVHIWGWWGLLAFPGIITLLAGIPWISYEYTEWRSIRVDAHKEPSVIIEGIKALKSRFCPIITIKREER